MPATCRHGWMHVEQWAGERSVKMEVPLLHAGDSAAAIGAAAVTITLAVPAASRQSRQRRLAGRQALTGPCGSGRAG